jgi:hypothetical protein
MARGKVLQAPQPLFRFLILDGIHITGVHHQCQAPHFNLISVAFQPTSLGLLPGLIWWAGECQNCPQKWVGEWIPGFFQKLETLEVEKKMTSQEYESLSKS